MLTLILPFPPTINSYYGTIKTGKFYKQYIKQAGKHYRTQVITHINSLDIPLHANIPLSVSILLNFPTNHRNDLDNRLKALLDALTHSEVWEDDSLIDELIVRRGEVIKGGIATVTISPYISPYISD